MLFDEARPEQGFDGGALLRGEGRRTGDRAGEGSPEQGWTPPLQPGMEWEMRNGGRIRNSHRRRRRGSGGGGSGGGDGNRQTLAIRDRTETSEGNGSLEGTGMIGIGVDLTVIQE